MKLRLRRWQGRPRRIAILTAGTLVAAGLTAVIAAPANAAVTCDVVYKVAGQWPNGFQGDVQLKNTGDAWTSWSVSWNYANGQRISQAWSSKIGAPGPSPATITNEAWNGNVPSGGSVTFGFIGS